MQAKIKDFLAKYEYKIIIAAAFILVAVLSFEAGMMKGKNAQQKAVVVNAAGDNSACQASSNQPARASNLSPEAAKTPQSNVIPTQNSADLPTNCVYIGSKNSNKYHMPNCRWARNIKPENRVCFSSENDAQLKGYQPDKNCIK